MFFGPIGMQTTPSIILSLTYILPLDQLDLYLDRGLGYPVPRHANPTDHAVDLVNTDFLLNADERSGRVTEYAEKWNAYAAEHGLGPKSDKKDGFEDKQAVRVSILSSFSGITGHNGKMMSAVKRGLRISTSRTMILMQRNMLNYNRNLLAYGVRFGMYRGLSLVFRMS